MARSGQIAIAAAGTAQRGPDEPASLVRLQGHPDNTGLVFVGDDAAGDVSSANGYPLAAGDSLEICVGNLSELWFDAATNDDVISWIKVR